MDKMPKPIDPGAEMARLDTDATIAVLHRILHFELNGVMKHYHHHWMSRWLQSSRPRAIAVGQHIASLTGGPSVGVGELMDEALASADEIMAEVRGYEQRRLDEYRKLLELVAGRSEDLESFARAQIAAEELHAAELTFDLGDARPQRPRA